MPLVRPWRRIIQLAAAILVFTAICSDPTSLPVHAYDYDDQIWSEPVELSKGTAGMNFFPKIISDGQGGLHVFWQETVEMDESQLTSIDYAYWDGTSWSSPVDVLIGSESWAITWGVDAIVDANGILHTVWVDGVSVKYAQRFIDSPVSAQSWLTPITLNLMPGGAIGPVAVAADGNILHVAYLHASTADPGIYYVRSLDGGFSWESPRRISEPGWRQWPLNQEDNYLDLLVVSGTVHVVWEQPAGQEIRYAKGEDQGGTWLWPIEIPQARRWPNLVSLGGDRLGLFAIATLDGQICLKSENLSLDFGQTWSTARQVAQPAKGCLVRVHVMPDSTGKFHMVMSGRTQFTDEPERIWYTEGDGERWLPSKLVTWPTTPYEALGRQPDFPSATISDGNRLNLVFHTFAGKIWYTSRPLDAPAIEHTIYPSPELTPAVLLQDTAPAREMATSPAPSVVTKALPKELLSIQPAQLQQNARSLPILIGVFFGISLFAVAFGLKKFQLWIRR